ncbi:MAG: DUF4403 family protein [Cytophagia bacterium]|nr:MAG: DUF4403 family protein [Cytophagales bacterium]TAG40909.1 MAG: DUF4403 family protein [Cytophagia bacterium]TAG55402.1 MAG: DUF4403 family protein [Runella slithyformis]TAG73316.1 MAG: DUF4403 family protein [Runella slithyformis]TAG82556.1 MAG: DUF4403 family protein [Cytophagales bacterium]
MFLKKQIISAALLVCLSMSCQKTPLGSTQPKAPAELYNHTNMEIQDEKHRSVVNIPVELALTDVAKQLNAQIQGLIYEDNSFEDNNNDGFKTKVWKRANITVEVRDSLLFYTVPLKIWAEKSYNVSPLGLKLAGAQATEFAINLHFFTQFSINPDWQVNTKTASAGFDWVTKPSIRVAGIEIPITGLVSRTISENLDKVSQSIDQNARASFDLKKYVLQAWNIIREPRLLSETYRTWLVITPTQISMTPFSMGGGHIKASLGVGGFTQTVIGIKPTVKPATEIPNLQITSNVPQGFQVGLIGVMPHEEAARLASQQFVGQNYEFQNGKYKIKVTSVDIYGQNDKLVIKAGLTGSLDGTVYLKGVPYYDPATRMLSLKNVDYDLHTRSLLLKTASWFLQGRFARQIEQQFTFPIGPQMDEVQKAIKQQLANRNVAKGVVMVGQLEALTPDQVYLTPTSLVALVMAKGRVEIKIDGLL